MMQRLPAVLTPLDGVSRLLCDGVRPVAPVDVPLADAIGSVAANNLPTHLAHPSFNVAIADGWAMRSQDLVGASSYSPLPLAATPVWVEAGEQLPDRCDCVVDAALIEQTGPMFQVVADVAPGHGIRRAGDDIAAGQSILVEGRRLNAFDLLVAYAAGIDRVSIRSPIVHIIDIPAADGNTVSSDFVAAFAESAGAKVIRSQANGRYVEAIARAISPGGSDLLVTVGGTGVGRTDATVEALTARGDVLAHGMALQPGHTAAAGKIGDKPLIAVPGSPDQAMAICLMLLQPLLDRLLARSLRQGISHPLARKVSSAAGVTELVLLEHRGETWMPLASGQFSLATIGRADAWFSVPPDSEGAAAGAVVKAWSLRDAM